MAGYISQDTIRLVAIGLLAVAAISMGAATIDSAEGFQPTGTNPEPVGIDRNGSSVRPGGNGSIGGINPGDNGTTGASYDLTWCAPILPSALGGIAYFGAFAGLLVFLKRRYSLGVAAFAMYGLAPIVLVVYFLSTSCATGDGGGGGQGPVGRVVRQAASTQIAQPDASPVMLVGLLGLILIATAAVILRSSSDQTIDPVEPDEEEEADGPDVADLAAAAGAAADRLEKHNVDVDNEVYRAWWEMTSLLDVPNPHSSTPGEFAAAAIEVGMGEQYVDELTRLFEEVRYGQRDPESREERAIEVFRAIEDEYGRDTSTSFEDENETDNTDAGSGSEEE